MNNKKSTCRPYKACTFCQIIRFILEFPHYITDDIKILVRVCRCFRRTDSANAVAGNRCSHMEKRGSRHLHFALINAAKFVYHWDETFGVYLQKKISKGNTTTLPLPTSPRNCTADLCNGKIRQALHKNSITFSV